MQNSPGNSHWYVRLGFRRLSLGIFGAPESHAPTSNSTEVNFGVPESHAPASNLTQVNLGELQQLNLGESWGVMHRQATADYTELT